MFYIFKIGIIYCHCYIPNKAYYYKSTLHYMVSGMDPPQKLNLRNAIDASKAWKNLKQFWEVYEVASGTNEKPQLVRLATFLHTAGQDALDQYNGFAFENADDKQNLEKVIEKCYQDCQTTIKILAERHAFFNRRQRADETYDQYVTALRTLSATCDFANTDETLRDQFTLNIRRVKVKERLLNEAQVNYNDLTINRTLMIAKSTETLYERSNTYTGGDQVEVNKVTANYERRKGGNRVRECRYCGGTHKKLICPAYGKTCTKCSKKNHFAKVCRSRSGSH